MRADQPTIGLNPSELKLRRRSWLEEGQVDKAYLLAAFVVEDEGERLPLFGALDRSDVA